MTIHDIWDGESLTVSLEGRLDTLSSPELDQFLQKYLPVAMTLTFDLEKLDYLSSAGLRVLLNAYKATQDRGGILILHPNKLVMEVFHVTGLDEVLKIES